MKYCNNCKYFVLATVQDCMAWTDYCNAPIGINDDPIYGKHRKGLNIDIRSIYYPNKIGICEFYKRKWWKFWVRE